MTYFLESIAQSLISDFGNTLNRHCIVFPNRRAGLYFLKYLASRIKNPVWAPPIFTVNELFRSYSNLQVAENEILLFELYKIYRKLVKSPESFDEFYFWGDMLLNDFDDIDKYLVNASLLFRNVRDLKIIDQQFGGLTAEQIEIIKRFWINFNPERPTREKTGFLSIWSLLNDIYSGFKSSLKDKNMAYEGMIFRELAENPERDLMAGGKWDIFHFIGFNALNECEKVVMSRIRKSGIARFYWDFEYSYLNDSKVNSAGFFLKENLKAFGNDMPEEWFSNNMASPGSQSLNCRIIETSSDVAQVKLISQLIEDFTDLTPDNAHHTAVVLADENLLIPVISSLPENIGEINITMGHPLKHTLVYTFIKQLMELQRSAITTDGITRFNSRYTISILKNRMISVLMEESDNEITEQIVKANMVWVSSDMFNHSEKLLKIFRKPLTPSSISDYFKDILATVAMPYQSQAEGEDDDSVRRNIENEFIYRIVLSVNRLETIANSSDVVFSTETYMKILDRMLRIQSVPFSGEPLAGIQIMGILETRALDFRNLIILSVNEGILPAVSGPTSYIPFSLREAFGLPSVNHQESIYAYHFFRLLQRAENVTLIYNSNSEGLRSGEVSRFITQMKFEKSWKTNSADLNFEIKTHTSIRERQPRTDEDVLQLKNLFFDKKKIRILSPSAINTWLNCRMKFYYRYLNLLKEPERISTDIDPAMLGNILHEIMKKLYHDYIGKVISKELLYSISFNKSLIESVTNDMIIEKFKNGRDWSSGGNEIIVREVLMNYIGRVLSSDMTTAPFTILNLEEQFSFTMPLMTNGSHAEIIIGGKVDRIDINRGVTRIVDYKTGTIAEKISSISDLFADDRKKEQDAWLQTLVYCEAYIVNNPAGVVRPSVYNIRKLTDEFLNDKLKIKSGYSNVTVIDDYAVVREEFLKNLKEVIITIFNKDEPFIMTSDIRGKCSFCPYKVLCMR